MNSQAQPELDAVFHALAHPIRRELLASLADASDTIVNLAAPFDVSLNAVSKHVKTLESAGLVTRTRDRTYHRVNFEAKALRPAMEWIEHYGAFWSQNLSSLKRELEDG